MEPDLIEAKKVVRTDIKYKTSPYAFHSLRIKYPEVAVRALGALYEEYNSSFVSLVEANREWRTDYRHLFYGSHPIMNFGVQIDMVGLTEKELTQVASMSLKEAIAFFRPRIFEIENSLALYHLLDRICDREGEERSLYSRRFRELLDSIRERFGRPIAVLAVTDQKYVAMRETDFGKFGDESLFESEVRELSGFDVFLGPEEFRRHLRSNHGDCAYLLYVRASEPIEKLKRPNIVVEHPLLGDTNMRRLIKHHAVTLNVDSPAWPTGDLRRINDTKRYMPSMGMAYEVEDESSLLTLPYVAGQILRAKPTQGTYGCYGHERGTISDSHFLRNIRRGIRERGSYLVQAEHPAPRVFNVDDGVEYAYIDRVFLGMMGGPAWLGGFREFLPADSEEAKAGRLHGNRETVFAEIL